MSVERGRRARRLLKDETMSDAFADVKGEIIERWVASDTVAEREACHARFVSLDAVRDTLEGYVGDVEYFEAQEPVDED